MAGIKSKKNRNADRFNGTKNKKDPGIPNLNFKQRKQNKEEANKKKIASNKERQDLARQNLQNRNRNLNLFDIVQNAEKRSQAFEETHEVDEDGKVIVDAAATGQKDNSKKAYYREFRKVLESADVILEVLDARDPLGTRTRSVERMVIDSGLDKKIILVLNKIDLVPKENVEQWLKYLRNEYPAIAFKASTQNQRNNLSQSTVSTDVASINMLNSAECLGADTLIRLLKNYCRNVNLKTSITVGIIGYPNVGKSSVINSLKRSKVCGVGSTPGFTKVAQQITLDKNIKLLDCPGIVFAQQGQDGQNAAEITLRNCVKVELLDDPVTPVEVIVSRCTTDQLMAMYEVPYFNNAHEFLVLLAQQRGKLKKGGVADTHQVARHVLQDWNGGKIPYYTIPPDSKKSHIEASVVNDWGKALDLDLADADGVLSGLKTSQEFGSSVVMQANEMDEMMQDTESQSMDAMMDQDEVLPSTQQPIIQVEKMLQMKKKHGSQRPQQIFSQTEEELNPQLNQQLKKQLKAQQKKARRQTEPITNLNDEDDDMLFQAEAPISYPPTLISAPMIDEDEEL
ncbi:Guanine nucleotide-binding protein-like NSN1 [Choanephora cucurbitarum]|uniref:Guanine nucleotide-binding protein-like NSN1 n=1 Tax=Choanephora cucurbitarum TaxID=101091 RepID=A0A1C7N0C1_9FUNG|nr:Guanine nucleotide-binding protein-like NSN1 [Choanephora cucurbitarum]